MDILFRQAVGAMIGAGFVRAAFGDGLGTFHHECAARGATAVCAFELADIAGWFCFDGIFACRVCIAAVEDAKASLAFHHLTLAAHGAGDTCFAFCGFFGIFFDKFALGVVAAGDEFAKASVAFHELAATIGAEFTGFFWPI